MLGLTAFPNISPSMFILKVTSYTALDSLYSCTRKSHRVLFLTLPVHQAYKTNCGQKASDTFPVISVLLACCKSGAKATNQDMSEWDCAPMLCPTSVTFLMIL